LLAVAALPVALAAQNTTLDVKPPAPLDQARFELADGAWRGGRYDEAAQFLEELLKDFPTSSLAPEAGYRLGATYLLLGKTAEAKETFDKLVEKHFDSPWAQLVLTAHYEEEPLAKLADARRKQARTAKCREDARAALKLFELYQRRFPNGSKSKEEVAYKMADSQLLAGDLDFYRAGLKKVVELDADGDWGKLAAIRLAGKAAFARNMDQLVRLSAGDAEQKTVFLEMAREGLPDLRGEDRARCLSYQAHCLPADKKEERRGLYRQIRNEHPGSPWAAEAVFWLAEMSYRDKDLTQTRALYKELADRYPQSPRAELARRWARWIDEQDATSKGLQALIAVLVRQLTQERGGLAFRLEAGDKEGKTLSLRFAWQERTQDALFQLTYREARMLLANNKDGMWYHPCGQAGLIKAPRMKLPSPHLVVKADPVTRDLGFNMAVSSDDEPSPSAAIQLAPAVPEVLQSWLQSLCHVHLERPQAGGPVRQIVRLEWATDCWDSRKPTEIEIELDADGRLLQVRGLFWRDDQHRSSAVVSDIVLGGTVPPAAFVVAVRPGTEVRTVEQINPCELMADGMRLFAVLSQQLKADLKTP
jgi:TolA-binding protein